MQSHRATRRNISQLLHVIKNEVNSQRNRIAGERRERERKRLSESRMKKNRCEGLVLLRIERMWIAPCYTTVNACDIFTAKQRKWYGFSLPLRNTTTNAHTHFAKHEWDGEKKPKKNEMEESRMGKNGEKSISMCVKFERCCTHTFAGIAHRAVSFRWRKVLE